MQRDICSARQRSVLAAIKRLTAKLGLPPSLRELSDELGFDSRTNGAHELLVAMRARGLVSWEANRCRTLRVCEPKGIPILGEVA